MSRDPVAWLKSGAGGTAPAEKVVETSIAWVFLYPDRALKLKKPVDFGFLDFTTADKRRWATERELAFNRETAPDVYRRVLRLTRDAAGRLALDGEGQAVDWVLEMRRFDDAAVLANREGPLDPALAEALGREIARFHAKSPRGPDAAARDSLAYVLDSNAQLLRRKAEALGACAVEALIDATQTEFDRLSEALAARGAQGFVRRCHGDLHLGNIMVEHGRPVLFDCVEFNDTLSQIDIAYDLAFLTMDLGFRGDTAGANRALNGWLDEAARGFGPKGLMAGLAFLPLMQSVRAAVRAHVTVNQNEPDLARRYLAAALGHLTPPRPKLVAVGGYSGSGKSTHARSVAPTLDACPGAVVLRSDEIRKRLWGAAPLDRLPPEAYAPGQSEPVYAAMFEAAHTALAAGRAVVLDAAFLKPAERAAAEAFAAWAGAPFEGIWMDAEPAALRARIAARTGDASDADVRVLDEQLARGAGEIGWRRQG